MQIRSLVLSILILPFLAQCALAGDLDLMLPPPVEKPVPAPNLIEQMQRIAGLAKKHGNNGPWRDFSFYSLDRADGSSKALLATAIYNELLEAGKTKEPSILNLQESEKLKESLRIQGWTNFDSESKTQALSITLSPAYGKHPDVQNEEVAIPGTGRKEIVTVYWFNFSALHPYIPAGAGENSRDEPKYLPKLKEKGIVIIYCTLDGKTCWNALTEFQSSTISWALDQRIKLYGGSNSSGGKDIKLKDKQSFRPESNN